MSASYVQVRDGNIYIGASRVTLESIVVNWRLGNSPESIHSAFPTVSLAAIYGGIAHYLDHQEEVDRYLRENEEIRLADQKSLVAARPEFYATMRQRFAEHAGRLGPQPSAASLSSEPASTKAPAAHSPLS